MPTKLTISEIVEQFQMQAAPVVVNNDMPGLKKLYSRCCADAQKWNPDQAAEARAAMRDALHQVLREPSARVRRNRFSNL